MLKSARSVSGLAFLVLAACGGPLPDFSVHGTGIIVNSTAPFTTRPDFPARVERTVEAALKYWGGSWAKLEGSTITFEGALHVRCGDAESANGCFDGDIRVSTRDPGFTFYCVEETALVHEVGHAVIGDPNHTDARWMDFAPVMLELDGQVGYAEAGEVQCRLFVSVWRHPPAR
jgi:hypothetical protein